MEPLIHKAEVAFADPAIAAGVVLGDFSALILESNDVVAVYVTRRSRLPFRFGGSVFVRLGSLGPQATEILLPALERNAALRVRIVEVVPAFLSNKGRKGIFISVWGDPKDILRPRKREHPVFSSTRKINAPAPDEDPPCADL